MKFRTLGLVEAKVWGSEEPHLGGRGKSTRAYDFGPSSRGSESSLKERSEKNRIGVTCSFLLKVLVRLQRRGNTFRFSYNLVEGEEGLGINSGPSKLSQLQQASSVKPLREGVGGGCDRGSKNLIPDEKGRAKKERFGKNMGNGRPWDARRSREEKICDQRAVIKRNRGCSTLGTLHRGNIEY